MPAQESRSRTITLSCQRAWEITPQFRYGILTLNRDGKSSPRAVRFDADNLTLTHNLSSPNDVMSFYLNDESNVAVRWNARIGL